MPEDEYVEPLTGVEIVNDLCGLIFEKLRSDCNLRDIDSYGGGYSAKVTIHLEAYGLDTITVDQQVTTGKAQAQADADPDELIDTTLEVPVEPALNVVRERSDQPVPSLVREDGQQPVVKQRRYQRHQTQKTVGAATGESLP